MADPTYAPPMPPQGSSPRTPAAPMRGPDIYIGGPAPKQAPVQKFGMSRNQSRQAIGNLRNKAEDRPLVTRSTKMI